MPISIFNSYNELIDLLVPQYKGLNGYDFYDFVFPNNENKGELNSDFSKPNAVYLYEDEADKGTKRRLRRRIMLANTWGEAVQPQNGNV